MLATRAIINHHRRAARLRHLIERTTARTALMTPVTSTPLDRIDGNEVVAIMTGPEAARAQFLRAYRNALGRLQPGANTAVTLDVDTLSPMARLLFLPVLIGAGDGRRFDRLDLVRSDFAKRQLVYTATGRAVDLAHWQRQLATITNLLGAPFRIIPMDGVSLRLEPMAILPPILTLTAELMAPRALFLGRDLTTGQPHYLALADLTHTLVVGPAGLGKSTFLHQLVLQLATDPTATDAVHLVDLKFGLEFAPYGKAAPHIHVIERYAELRAVLPALISVMESRIAELKAAGATSWSGPPILLIVDEFAQIMLEPDTKDGRQQILDGFIRLGNQARAAGIFLWVQVQHAVAETLPTPLRRNLTATIAFRQPSAQAAALLFGDTGDMPADITRLKPGQFIYRSGKTSETFALQAALVGHADMPRLLR